MGNSGGLELVFEHVVFATSPRRPPRKANPQSGLVDWPKSWLCSFSTSLAQKQLTSLVAKYLPAVPGWIGPGCVSAKLDRAAL